MPSALHIFKYQSVLTAALQNRCLFYHFVDEKNSKTLKQFPQGPRIGNGRAGIGPQRGHRGRALYTLQRTKLADATVEQPLSFAVDRIHHCLVQADDWVCAVTFVDIGNV